MVSLYKRDRHAKSAARGRKRPASLCLLVFNVLRYLQPTSAQPASDTKFASAPYYEPGTPEDGLSRGISMPSNSALEADEIHGLSEVQSNPGALGGNLHRPGIISKNKPREPNVDEALAEHAKHHADMPSSEQQVLGKQFYEDFSDAPASALHRQSEAGLREAMRSKTIWDLLRDTMQWVETSMGQLLDGTHSTSSGEVDASGKEAPPERKHFLAGQVLHLAESVVDRLTVLAIRNAIPSTTGNRERRQLEHDDQKSQTNPAMVLASTAHAERQEHAAKPLIITSLETQRRSSASISRGALPLGGLNSGAGGCFDLLGPNSNADIALSACLATNSWGLALGDLGTNTNGCSEIQGTTLESHTNPDLKDTTWSPPPPLTSLLPSNLDTQFYGLDALYGLDAFYGLGTYGTSDGSLLGPAAFTPPAPRADVSYLATAKDDAHSPIGFARKSASSASGTPTGQPPRTNKGLTTGARERALREGEGFPHTNVLVSELFQPATLFPAPTEYFTHDAPFDLSHRSLVFTPSSAAAYRVCLEDSPDVRLTAPVEAVPPTTAAHVELGTGRASAAAIPLSAAFLFFNDSYTKVLVEERGRITFLGVGGGMVGEAAPSSMRQQRKGHIDDHFDTPGVSLLLLSADHELPPGGVSVWYEEVDLGTVEARLLVTWQLVGETSSTPATTAHVELHYSTGVITLSWGAVEPHVVENTLVGLSPGGMIPPQFQEVDLSAVSLCTALPTALRAPAARAESADGNDAAFHASDMLSVHTAPPARSRQPQHHHSRHRSQASSHLEREVAAAMATAKAANSPFQELFTGLGHARASSPHPASSTTASSSHPASSTTALHEEAAVPLSLRDRTRQLIERAEQLADTVEDAAGKDWGSANERSTARGSVYRVGGLEGAPDGSAALYYPYGVQREVPESVVTGGGWELCFDGSDTTALQGGQYYFADCQGDHVLLAARGNDGEARGTLRVLAAGKRAEVLRETTSTEEAYLHNGGAWAGGRAGCTTWTEQDGDWQKVAYHRTDSVHLPDETAGSTSKVSMAALASRASTHSYSQSSYCSHVNSFCYSPNRALEVYATLTFQTSGPACNTVGDGGVQHGAPALQDPSTGMSASSSPRPPPILSSFYGFYGFYGLRPPPEDDGAPSWSGFGSFYGMKQAPHQPQYGANLSISTLTTGTQECSEPRSTYFHATEDSTPALLSTAPTQMFAHRFDLAATSIACAPTYRPSAGNSSKSFEYYACCREVHQGSCHKLPDPVSAAASSAQLPDDGWHLVELRSPFTFFGERYQQVYVSSNGQVAFTAPSAGAEEFNSTLTHHFSRPRVAVLHTDLNPEQGGGVKYELLDAGTLSERLVVTWEGVPEYFDTGASHFQVALYLATGKVRMSWAQVTTAWAIVGLSPGGGVPANFSETDFSQDAPVCVNANNGSSAGGLIYRDPALYHFLGSEADPVVALPAENVAAAGNAPRTVLLRLRTASRADFCAVSTGRAAESQAFNVMSYGSEGRCLGVMGYLNDFHPGYRGYPAHCTPVNDGAWHHVAVTFDGAGGDLLVYVDGVVDNRAEGKAYDTTGQDNFLGRSNDAEYPDLLVGEVHGVAFYDRALSGDEIALAAAAAGAGFTAPADAVSPVPSGPTLSRSIEEQYHASGGFYGLPDNAQLPPSGMLWTPTPPSWAPPPPYLLGDHVYHAPPWWLDAGLPRPPMPVPVWVEVLPEEELPAVTLRPGESYEQDIELINNGDREVHFAVQVEYWSVLLDTVEAPGAWGSGPLVPLSEGHFRQVAAVWRGGWWGCDDAIACGKPRDPRWPWQACRDNCGGTRRPFSFELLKNGEYVLEQPAWGALPLQCTAPANGTDDIVCDVDLVIAEGDTLTVTWHDVSHSTATSSGDHRQQHDSPAAAFGTGTLVLDLMGLPADSPPSVSSPSSLSSPPDSISGGGRRLAQAGFPQGSTTSASASFSRTFSTFSNRIPSTSGNVEVYIGGTSCAGGGLDSSFSTDQSPAFTTATKQAASISLLLRTSTIYVDSYYISAQYYVRDEDGRPQVTTSGITVNLVMTAGSTSLSSACSSPSSSTGAATCSYTSNGLSSEFSTSGNVTGSVKVQVLYSDAVVAESSSLTLTLGAKASHTALSEPNMVITMPYSPRFGGDSFTSQVLARTTTSGGTEYVLGSFNAIVYYTSSILTFSSLSGDSKYASPTVNSGTDGVVNVVVSRLSSSTTDADVTGTAVTLFTVTFSLVSSATVGTSSNVLSLSAYSMVTTANVEFASQKIGQVDDAHGGAQTQGQLTVTELAQVGIYAYAAQAELFNTAYLDGTDVTSSITVKRVYNKYGESDTTTTAATCLGLADATVATLSSCDMVLTSSQSAGESSLSVSVTDGTYSTSVRFRVWFPSSITVMADDAELNAVTGAKQASSCSSSLYQGTELAATATWGGSGLTSVANVDVTCLVSFESSDSGVASVSGTTATGIALGTATVSISGGASGLSASTSVTVTDTVVTVSVLSAVLVTGATWSGVDSSVSLAPSTAFTAQTTFVQSLTAEEDSGPIYVFAHFSDGYWQEVPSADGSGVTVNSSYSSALTVSMESFGSADFKGTVPDSPSSADSEQLLTATWTDSCDSTTIASGFGGVTVALATPTSATITASPTKISRSSDGAANSPINTATSSTLTVTGTFDDGTSKDFTLDSRSTYTVTSGGALVEVTVGTSSVTASVIDGTADFGSATIEVSFPTYASSITATVTVTVIGTSSVALSSNPYPTYSGSSSFTESVLSLVQCTSTYQRAVLTATATLSDGTTHDVLSESSYAISQTSGLSVTASNGRVVASADGSYDVTATYYSVASTAFTYTVESNRVSVTSLTHTTSWSGSNFPTTFYAVKDSTKTLSVTAVFSDGTQFTDIVGGTQSSWVADTEYATFTSDAADKISVTAAGVATLLDNHYQAVALMATSMCSTSDITDLVSGTMDVYANLRPATNDVDLGLNDGVQFTSTAVGGTFSVPVQIETGSNTLNLYDILLTIVDTDVRATACSVGSDWADYTFSCTINDPPTQVLITGTEISTTKSGLVTVATVTLQVQSGASTLSPIVGTIQGLLTSDTSSEISVALGNQVAIVAGLGAHELSSSRRRQLLEVEILSAYASRLANARAQQQRELDARRARRHLLQTTSDVLGDVNRDGYFDTFDVQALKNWVAGSSGYTDPTSLTTFQRQQFDPTLDFLTAPDDTSKCPQGWTYGTPCPHTQDIVYSNYVYANFYRWMKLSSPEEVDAAVSVPPEPTGVLTFSVLIYGKDNAVVSDTTVVQFEIGVTGDNLQMQWSVGTYVSSSEDGVLVTASRPSSGVYTASATGPVSNGNSFVAESAVGTPIITNTPTTPFTPPDPANGSLTLVLGQHTPETVAHGVVGAMGRTRITLNHSCGDVDAKPSSRRITIRILPVGPSARDVILGIPSAVRVTQHVVPVSCGILPSQPNAAVEAALLVTAFYDNLTAMPNNKGGRGGGPTSGEGGIQGVYFNLQVSLSMSLGIAAGDMAALLEVTNGRMLRSWENETCKGLMVDAVGEVDLTHPWQQNYTIIRVELPDLHANTEALYSHRPVAEIFAMDMLAMENGHCTDKEDVLLIVMFSEPVIGFDSDALEFGPGMFPVVAQAITGMATSYHVFAGFNTSFAGHTYVRLRSNVVTDLNGVPNLPSATLELMRVHHLPMSQLVSYRLNASKPYMQTPP
ncbi:hypothetical protein CYMTET_47799 [Cymbomonas tetramitiformis]|uniref:Transmembrane protein family 132 fourth domain-containing protein n=1 Tax=Cymbomonas tetramitiformis TaxID=36881 RepID=A0AAE0BVE3_9CHLO|nr:hypothetical protein CYMTET_47799 [Cymbomonas tetramitiformis]